MYSLRYYIDSWIEVASQPSSSSLSSATEDIVTTGLRVHGPGSATQHHRSRRRRARLYAAAMTTQVRYSREPSVASSSQDEYEESESESDRVLSSSNEGIVSQPHADALQLNNGSVSGATTSSEDDDRSTALGLRISASPFVPQPNLFSHPPARHHNRAYSSTEPQIQASRSSEPTPSVVSNASRATAIRRTSYSGPRTARRTQHSPYNMIAPAYQADHDAALRASLSTLLSCAAAARGLPKNDGPPTMTASSAAEPTSFRLVTESVAIGGECSDIDRSPGTPLPPTGVSVSERSSRQPRGKSSASPGKPKRPASSFKDRPYQPSTSKKSRHGPFSDSVATVSPSVMTWVISAGVVVLFSAISFSAGYALGREVGRTETGGGIRSFWSRNPTDSISGARASAGCGRDAVNRGIGHLGWGGAAASGVSVYN